MEEINQPKKKPNPATLGLMGFGMTTVLLNFHNVGIFELNVMLGAMGFAFGGLGQIIAGVLELKEGNTFGGTVFTSYALFWWSLVVIWINPGGMAKADKVSVGCYLLIWGVFSAFMFIVALRHDLISKLLFGSLVLLFLLLAIGNFADSEVVIKIAGGIGIFCGFTACYSGMGKMISEEFGKPVFPFLLENSSLKICKKDIKFRESGNE